jgi:putative solute:sodium symporter small subunit
MLEVLKSASKIVFILMAISACLGFFLKILDADKFMILSGMAFSFYFANKGETTTNFAGK